MSWQLEGLTPALRERLLGTVLEGHDHGPEYFVEQPAWHPNYQTASWKRALAIPEGPERDAALLELKDATGPSLVYFGYWELPGVFGEARKEWRSLRWYWSVVEPEVLWTPESPQRDPDVEALHRVFLRHDSGMLLPLYELESRMGLECPAPVEQVPESAQVEMAERPWEVIDAAKFMKKTVGGFHKWYSRVRQDDPAAARKLGQIDDGSSSLRFNPADFKAGLSLLKGLRR